MAATLRARGLGWQRLTDAEISNPMQSDCRTYRPPLTAIWVLLSRPFEGRVACVDKLFHTSTLDYRCTSYPHTESLTRKAIQPAIFLRRNVGSPWSNKFSTRPPPVTDEEGSIAAEVLALHLNRASRTVWETKRRASD